jgi:hypothetical protein
MPGKTMFQVLYLSPDNASGMWTLWATVLYHAMAEGIAARLQRDMSCATRVVEVPYA